MRPRPRHAAPARWSWRRLRQRLPRIVPLSGLSLLLAVGVLALAGALLSSPSGAPYVAPAEAAPVESAGKPEPKQPGATVPSSKASTVTTTATLAPPLDPSTEARRLTDQVPAPTVEVASPLISLDASPRSPDTTSPPGQGASPSAEPSQETPEQMFERHKARHSQGNGYAYGKGKHDQEKEPPRCE